MPTVMLPLIRNGHNLARLGGKTAWVVVGQTWKRRLLAAFGK